MKINGITTTVVTVISIFSLTSTNIIGVDNFLTDKKNTVSYGIISQDTCSSLKNDWFNSSSFTHNNFTSNSLMAQDSETLIQSLAQDLFGNMRSLTQEENEQKNEMYRKISTVVEGVNFFD